MRWCIAVALAMAAVGSARADSCKEEEKDERGDCPKAKPKPAQPVSGKPKPAPAAPKLDVRATDGAEVWVDDELKGRSPVILATTPGRHRVEVKGDGGFVQWVDVKAGEVKRVAAKVATTTSPPPPTTTTKKKGACPADMVRVEGGTFQMGNPDGVGDSDEHPQHTVTLAGYCIDKTEVTVAAYAACVSAGGCTAPESGGECNGGVAGREQHPINCVSWDESKKYCEWAKKRLPTEAEWEYAARGKDGRTYPWGNEAPTSARLNWNNEHKGTTPVGSFPTGASPFGALDMAGNVWEWTADGYGPYHAEAAANPAGDASSAHRVVRGGGLYNSAASDVRAANRDWDDPGYRFDNLGVRCARGD